MPETGEVVSVTEFLTQLGDDSIDALATLGRLEARGEVIVVDGFVTRQNTERAGPRGEKKKMTEPHQGESQAGSWVATRPSISHFTPKMECR